jgi:photosystem II stability/assembly factor-like uncharacterized protein
MTRLSRLTPVVAISLLVLAPGPRTSLGAQEHGAMGTGRFEHVHALAFDAGGRVLWLGAHTGLFRSEDGGTSWQPVTLSTAHAHLDVMAIATHPTAADLIYAGTHEAGVLKTIDGGKTWKATNRGLGGLDVHGLVIDPTAPDKLHAAVREKGSGIYRTTTSARGGWVRVDDGPAGETKVLASVNIPTGMGGIWLYAGTAEGLQRSPDCF